MVVEPELEPDEVIQESEEGEEDAKVEALFRVFVLRSR